MSSKAKKGVVNGTLRYVGGIIVLTVQYNTAYVLAENSSEAHAMCDVVWAMATPLRFRGNAGLQCGVQRQCGTSWVHAPAPALLKWQLTVDGRATRLRSSVKGNSTTARNISAAQHRGTGKIR